MSSLPNGAADIPRFVHFELLAANPGCQPVLERIATLAGAQQPLLEGAGRPWRVRKLLRGAPHPLELTRAYLSYQRALPGETLAFQAETVEIDLRRGRAARLSFPADRKLPELPVQCRALRARARALGGALEVLRYVPWRRVTFACGPGGAGGIVAKAVEGDEARLLAQRLASVPARLARAGLPVRIAARVEYDEASALVLQERLAGAPLAGQIDAGNAPALLDRLGRVHAQLHAIDPTGLPATRALDALGDVHELAGWVALAVPGRAAAVHALAQRLARQLGSAPASDATFCHGDFRSTQILADHDDWALIDLDECGAGDPRVEVGRALAMLDYDVDALGADAAALRAARTAYLRGYAAVTRRALDPATIFAWRCAWTLYVLARQVRRDLAGAAALAAGLDRLLALESAGRQAGVRLELEQLAH